MGEETTLLSPDNHGIRLKLIAIETPGVETMDTAQSFDERVWISMLDANRLGRYYLVVADRWKKWHLGLSAASVFGSLLAATVLLSPLGTPVNELVSAFFFLVVSGATTVMVVFDFSGRSQRARSAAEEMNSIEVELRRLPGSEGDIQLIKNLEGRVDIANRNDLPIDDNLNKRCNEAAAEAVYSYYPRPDRGATEAAPTG